MIAAEYHKFEKYFRIYAEYKILYLTEKRNKTLMEETLNMLRLKRVALMYIVDEALFYFDTTPDPLIEEGFKRLCKNTSSYEILFRDLPENAEIKGVSYLTHKMAVLCKADILSRREERRGELQEAGDESVYYPVHSSMPAYDVGETIARGDFKVLPGKLFPGAEIVGDTVGRIELLPFWDLDNNLPVTVQEVNFIANTDAQDLIKMQDEALKIATSYNEEMATYYYAMDAYWLMNAKSPDEYILLQIDNLLHLSGKKTVKSGGEYSSTFRPEQLQRAGAMVYGMGFSMVEIERTVVRGKGERTHYKRLWDYRDVYVMTTLEGDTLIESVVYRPNELFRNASFGARRETALLMSAVLSLDYDKMVTARRLGRYYTWLWRNRMHSDSLDSPVSCETLIKRAGIQPEDGKGRYARKSLEGALDRLETKGIIGQWLLCEADGIIADTGVRIPFKRWLQMKIAVTPPKSILKHYTPKFTIKAPHKEEEEKLDFRALKSERARRGATLAMVSVETGVDISTLSRIENGKTKRPGVDHIKAINAWLNK